MIQRYSIVRVSPFSVRRLIQVERILYSCGKDMAEKEGLYHWDNPHFKNILILILCALKNRIHLIYNSSTPVATFQTRTLGDSLYFYKLATVPSLSNKGIGTYCLDEIERQASVSGCKSSCCEVYNKSIHAIEFYKHRGYSVVVEKKTLKYTELILEKRIHS